MTLIMAAFYLSVPVESLDVSWLTLCGTEPLLALSVTPALTQLQFDM